MEPQAKKSKKYTFIYIGVILLLSAISLSTFTLSQFFKAKANSSKTVMDNSATMLKSLEIKKKTEAIEDEIAFYEDLNATFTYVYNRDSNLYKATAIPAYIFSMLTLVGFGVCLMHADKMKEKEDQ